MRDVRARERRVRPLSLLWSGCGDTRGSARGCRGGRRGRKPARMGGSGRILPAELHRDVAPERIRARCLLCRRALRPGGGAPGPLLPPGQRPRSRALADLGCVAADDATGTGGDPRRDHERRPAGWCGLRRLHRQTRRFLPRAVLGGAVPHHRECGPPCVRAGTGPRAPKPHGDRSHHLLCVRPRRVRRRPLHRRPGGGHLGSRADRDRSAGSTPDHDRQAFAAWLLAAALPVALLLLGVLLVIARVASGV